MLKPIDKLHNAISAIQSIAKDHSWRESFIKSLIIFENSIDCKGTDVRETITGPIVDLLFSECEILQKKILNGITIEYFYRSKIARDFFMASPETPDHVWEPQTTKLLQFLSQSAENVIIGGAYFGDHAILIAKEIEKNNGTVHAFEPNTDQRNILERNAAINKLKNIKTNAEGLWNQSGIKLQLLGYDSFAKSSAIDRDDFDHINTITLDRYIHDNKIHTVDLIMLDIEGAEFNALQGASGFLSATTPEKLPNIIFEIHKNYVDWSNGIEKTEIISFLQHYGYKIFAIRDFQSNVNLENIPVELIPISSIYLEGPPHGFNMVAVQDESLFKNKNFIFVENRSPKLLKHKEPELHHPISWLTLK